MHLIKIVNVREGDRSPFYSIERLIMLLFVVYLPLSQ